MNRTRSRSDLLSLADDLLADDEVLALHTDWIDRDRASALFATLLADAKWRQQSIVLFGREILEPRLTAWCGDPGAIYTYSGRRNEPDPWLPDLDSIRQRLSTEFGESFNSALLNLYRDGHDSMGMHSDDEADLGPDPRIASISLGATRHLRLQHRENRSKQMTLALDHGSLLIMGGALQHRWRHGVRKEPKVMTPRINVTFRRVQRISG